MGFFIGVTVNYTKRCTKCQREFPATLEFFHKDKNRKDGFRHQCKICVNIYYRQNKHKILKKAKQYRETNKDKILECKKKYRNNNKEKISENGKQYYKANKEKISKQKKQYSKQCYEANKEEILEKTKQYRKKNRHLTRQWDSKRRAAKLKQTPDYANLDLIKLIYKYCPDGYEVDHMVPISDGGLHHESNLCYLPKGVNQSKGAKTIEEFGEEEFNKHVIYWQDILLYNQ